MSRVFCWFEDLGKPLEEAEEIIRALRRQGLEKIDMPDEIDYLF